MNLPRRTKKNEAYYIALIEGLRTTREYGSNAIVVFTNSELVCNQMKGMYQVKKERLKQLHGKANNIVRKNYFFSIGHCSNVNKMYGDLLCGAMPIQDSSLKYELVLRRSPSKFIDGNFNISLICVCFLLRNASFLMTLCFLQLYTKCAPTM